MSNIILPNGNENFSNDSMEEIKDRETKHRFEVDFCLSYKDFKMASGTESDVSKQVIDRWAESVFEAQQFKLPTNAVLSFFGIPDKYSDKIDNKQYRVDYNIKENDTINCILVIHLSLTLNELPKIFTDNMPK